MSLDQPVVARASEPALNPRAVFTRTARLLATAGDFREALEQTLAACLPVLGDFGFFDAREGDGAVRVAHAHQDERVESILRPTRWIRQEHSDLNLCALSTGIAALHAHVDDAWYRKVAANEQHLAAMRDLGFRSMITVPMHFRGELIGALTLFMGRSQRRHGPAHLELASDIAAMAAPVVANARLLEAHGRMTEALRTSEERLQLAQSAAGLGAWDWNVATHEVYWSPTYRELYGLAPTQPPSFEAGMAMLAPEDRDAVADTMARALQARAEYRSLHQIRHPHRGRRWIEAVGRATYDSRGLPVRVTGVATDVTDRHNASEDLRKLRDQLAAELEALRRLHQITLSSAKQGRNAGAVLEELLAAALDITGRDQGSIHLLEGATLRLAASRGSERPLWDRLRTIALDEAMPSAMAARRRERVVIEDIAAELAGSPHLATLREAGVRAMQATPLVSRSGDVIGTFSTHLRSRGVPSEREMRLLDMLSRAAADLVEWGQVR